MFLAPFALFAASAVIDRPGSIAIVLFEAVLFAM